MNMNLLLLIFVCLYAENLFSPGPENQMSIELYSEYINNIKLYQCMNQCPFYYINTLFITLTYVCTNNTQFENILSLKGLQKQKITNGS